MKRIINLIIVISAVIIVGCSSVVKENELESVVFDTSIHCDKCINTIYQSLPHEEGIEDLKADLATKKVTVVFDKLKTNKKTIRELIIQLGYTAEESLLNK